MKGTIIEFSMQQSGGAIAGDDGYRYEFHASEWRSDDAPTRDTRVEFATDNTGVHAFDVAPLTLSSSNDQLHARQPHARQPLGNQTTGNSGSTAAGASMGAVGTQPPRQGERANQQGSTDHYAAQSGGPGGQPGRQHPPLPENYLIWAIVATVLCCLPTGIVAIVYASKVNSLHQNGQYDEANQTAQKAKKWVIGSVVLGIGFLVVALVGGFLGGNV